MGPSLGFCGCSLPGKVLQRCSAQERVCIVYPLACFISECDSVQGEETLTARSHPGLSLRIL